MMLRVSFCLKSFGGGTRHTGIVAPAWTPARADGGLAVADGSRLAAEFGDHKE